LIVRKIIEIVATRCYILRVKCTKFDFDWGSAPDHAGGSLQRSPRSPSWISGVLLLREGGEWKGRERREGEGKGRARGREGKRREGKGRGRKGEGKEGEGRNYVVTPPVGVF